MVHTLIEPHTQDLIARLRREEKMSHAEIARNVGVAKSSVCRILKKFENQQLENQSRNTEKR